MAKLLFLLLIFNCGWTLALYGEPTHTTVFNYLYNLSYGCNFLLALILSLRAVRACHPHRLLHLWIGLGSLAFFLAQMVWLYYNLVLQAAIPFPGLADLFWLLFYLCLLIFSLLLYRELKVKLTLTTVLETLSVFILIFCILYSFITLGTTQEELAPLTRMLNLSYPVFDALLLALSVTALRSQLGHLQPKLLFFIATFVALSFGDALFAYQTTFGVYWNGNVVDTIFAAAGFFFTLGVHSLDTLLHAAPSPIGASSIATSSRQVPA